MTGAILRLGPGNYVLYENEKFTTKDSWQRMEGSNPAKPIPIPDTTPTHGSH